MRAVATSPEVNAVKLAADEINAKGGVLGKKIELIIADTEGDPAKAANIAASGAELEVYGKMPKSRSRRTPS